FKGAIANGTASQVFTLPATVRPATNVYVPIDMCNATNGRLFIQPSGVVTVQAETSFRNAQCFTSLDGVSFARRGATGFTPLALANGWTNSTFGTGAAAYRNIGGTIQFAG